jgi:putative ABC transport system permease protein
VRVRSSASLPPFIESRTEIIEQPAGYFEVLGVRPMLGRTFLPGEDQPGRGRVAVLSHAIWQRRFASDPRMMGKTVALDGETSIVVGVMPAEFRLSQFLTQIWTPLVLSPKDMAPQARDSRSFLIFARLNTGITIEKTRAAMRTLALVLLIACVNVANLILARGSARRQEIAVRMAIGSGRVRVTRQLLVESLLIAAVGGAAGLLLAYWGVDVLRGTLHFNAGVSAIAQDVALERRVLAFTCLISLPTAVVFGLAPTALVGAQLAVTVLLVSGAALMIKACPRKWAATTDTSPAAC